MWHSCRYSDIKVTFMSFVLCRRGRRNERIVIKWT